MANPASYNFGQPDQIDTPPQQGASGGFDNSEQDVDYEERSASERPTIAPNNQTPGELDQNAGDRAPRTAKARPAGHADHTNQPQGENVSEPAMLEGQRRELGIGAPDVPLGMAPVEQARYRALRQIYDAIDVFAASIPGAERYTQRAKDAATSAIDHLRREALGGAKR